jgi:hypothetical protein
MFFEVLDVARNVSVILLALIWIVLSLVPLFILLKITQGLRKLLPKVAPAMRQAHGKLQEFHALVVKIMAAIRTPFEKASRAAAWMRAQGARVPTLGHHGR